MSVNLRTDRKPEVVISCDVDVPDWISHERISGSVGIETFTCSEYGNTNFFELSLVPIENLFVSDSAIPLLFRLSKEEWKRIKEDSDAPSEDADGRRYCLVDLIHFMCRLQSSRELATV